MVPALPVQPISIFVRLPAFRRLEEDIAEVGLNLEFVEHPQGGTKRGKPTEAMKLAVKSTDREPQGLWMPGSVRQLEEMMLEGRIRLRRNPVLISAIMSAVIETDRWDNYWLSKQRALNKIDAAVALCMAVGASMMSDHCPPASPWDDPAFTLAAL
jgi:phage terminase large subunit-like protein